ncbi:UNVERIFIED_CONTAM: hypothetical protein FKN15_036971 [Acipenser sinensis]
MVYKTRSEMFVCGKYAACEETCVVRQRRKTEKHMLEEKLHRTEDDLSKRLSITQQTLAEKTKELDRLRNEWSSHASLLTNRHTQDVTAERDKSLQIQSQCQIKYEQQKREMEMAHSRAVQHLESRVRELESTNKELTERKYKSDSAIRELKAKLTGLEEVDAYVHQMVLWSRDRLRPQLTGWYSRRPWRSIAKGHGPIPSQLFVKKKLEESVEHKQLLIGNFEATVKSLSEELLKANEIIKKLQGDMKKLMEKMKLKNAVTMQQEKLLTEKEQMLKKETLELDNLKRALDQKEDEASKLQEQLDSTAQKLDESKQLLKTNENVISWLNKQLNENKIASVQGTAGFCDSAMPGSISSKPSVMQNSLLPCCQSINRDYTSAQVPATPPGSPGIVLHAAGEERRKKASAWEKNLVYPVVMLILLAGTTISVLLVVFNILYLLVDETAMPRGSKASKVQNVLITGHSKVLAIGNIAGGTYSVGSDEKQDLIEH